MRLSEVFRPTGVYLGPRVHDEIPTTGGPTHPIYKLAKGLLMPVASGGIHIWHMPALIHIWHMPALVDIFGDDACLQFSVGTTSKG